MFPLANKIGGRVSGNMQLDALKALFISLLGMVIYLWVRFQKLMYGIAAAVALVARRARHHRHDRAQRVHRRGRARLGVGSEDRFVPDQPRRSSPRCLTIIGYSVNDTIVTFDRLREIKGKSPKLTAEMVNASVNQCLSRTILTSLTVFITVVILYFWGGDGIHGFAFAFLVGVRRRYLQYGLHRGAGAALAERREGGTDGAPRPNLGSRAAPRCSSAPRQTLPQSAMFRRSFCAEIRVREILRSRAFPVEPPRTCSSK